MDENAIRTILAILKRHNEVVIRRKGDGYVIIENGQKIRYRVSGRLGNADEIKKEKEKENEAPVRGAPMKGTGKEL